MTRITMLEEHFNNAEAWLDYKRVNDIINSDKPFVELNYMYASEEPKLRHDNGAMEDPTGFTGGYRMGRVLVYDIKNMRVLCSALYVGSNSDDISFDETAENIYAELSVRLDNDLTDRTQKAINEAKTKIYSDFELEE